MDKHFLQAGIWYIDDLCKENGEVKPFEQWVSRGLARHKSIKWLSLISKTKLMYQLRRNTRDS